MGGMAQVTRQIPCAGSDLFAALVWSLGRRLLNPALEGRQLHYKNSNKNMSVLDICVFFHVPRWVKTIL